MNKLAQAFENSIRAADAVACTRGVTTVITLSTKKTTTKTTFGV
ncbi:MAG: hypothetical protein REI94_04355 [Moraxellaceae bacterium]|nr:hypothetical protein [Moraxellaceae bacterium]